MATAAQKQAHIDNLAVEQERRSRSAMSHNRVSVPTSAHVLLDHRDHYKRMARQAVFVVLLQGVCLLCMAAALVYMSTRPVTTLSFLSDDEGRVVEMVPLEVPTVSDSQLLLWASDRIADIQGLSFTNYRDHILGLRRYFTGQGFEQYQRALVASKTLDKIKRDRLISWVQPTAAPIITDKGVVDGRMSWIVEMPFVVFYEGGETSTRTDALRAQLVVQRTSRTVNAAGLVISQYLVKKEGVQ